jgi:hypothetical protein
LDVGGVIFALIEGPARGWSETIVWTSGAGGAVCLILFAV